MAGSPIFWLFVGRADEEVPLLPRFLLAPTSMFLAAAAAALTMMLLVGSLKTGGTSLNNRSSIFRRLSSL